MSRPAKRTVTDAVRTRRGGTTVGQGSVDGADWGGTTVTALAGVASRSSGRSAARSRRYYWLVVGDSQAGSDLPILWLDDGRGVLPVFGFEEEACIFARRTRRGGRAVRRTGADGLVSLLRGPLRGVELVALDPLSDTPADVLNGSASLTRQRFLNFLLGAGSTAEGARGLADGPRETSDRRSP